MSLALVQALVLQRLLQAIEGRGHVGFAEDVAEGQTQRRYRHCVAGRLMQAVHQDVADVKILPHHEIDAKTARNGDRPGHHVGIAAGAKQLAQAFALGVRGERLAGLQAQRRGIFLQDRLVFVDHAHGHDFRALQLLQDGCGRGLAAR